MFEEKLNKAPLALTFRDVILLPGYARVEPHEVVLKTKVTKNYELNIPLVSSPMDTVTEADMAIALARLGALGVIHRNCSIEEQVELVKRVKEADDFVDHDIRLTPSSRVEDAIRMMEKRNVSLIPVMDDEGNYIGIIHKVHAYLAPKEAPVINYTTKFPFATKDKSIEEILNIMKDLMVSELPVVHEGKLLGLITVRSLSHRRVFLDASRGKDGRLLCAAAISPFDRERALKLDKFVDILVMDVAHFHNENCIAAAKRLEKEVSADIVIGNIGTKEAALDILSRLEKVDGFRVGIGSGSICTTGEVTGALAPTLFAVAQVADATHEMKCEIPIIADGGIRSAADAAKAIAVGASAVMTGYLLAGCDESPGPMVEFRGRKYKYYRGMASHAAKRRRFAIDRYSRVIKEIEEGIEALVPYRGPVERVVIEFANALKAAFGYAGARNVKEMWEKARLALITPLGAKEAGPHSIIPMRLSDIFKDSSTL
ncbi:MAG: IMP dehydrogenase [Thermoprotei archaeon]|nr:MAG: IMP dehydrogenase [Thermoprotei archaeon]